ncbi:MAG: hypothetical protein GKR98_02995 [Boseongicola sp.]|nr:MAG: hypothetical protein GKR98_02995 [Boseongicola sp.]
MPHKHPSLLIVAQSGRLTYEAVLLAASLRHSAPNFQGKLIVAEPEAGNRWPENPGIADPDARGFLTNLGAEIRQFESRHFGAQYPIGNKIEALQTLDKDEPFLFLDSDTLITGPLDQIQFDFDRPAASMARSNTWPEPQLYGPGYSEIWQCLYDRFNVAFEPTLDLTQPDEHWERYLYFNAGWFYYKDPLVFHDLMIEVMTSIRDEPPIELACQSLFPWLDHIALPIVISKLNGGRPGPELDGLDGALTWHWRALPLLYAKATPLQLREFQAITAPNRVKKVLKQYEPFRRMIYQNRGDRVSALFDRGGLPKKERAIRARIKRKNLWMR